MNLKYIPFEGERPIQRSHLSMGYCRYIVSLFLLLLLNLFQFLLHLGFQFFALPSRECSNSLLQCVLIGSSPRLQLPQLVVRSHFVFHLSSSSQLAHSPQCREGCLNDGKSSDVPEGNHYLQKYYEY
ncbi:hypothetical protein PMAYCL1PPCAC_18669 [Pristionchus mayeri]|uniref:Uncharacterized protein n=1 Tax=Pristionchus mayeri TaxID=1317129 RepID=A0AAN5CQB7_9BILA|nr:hypothetical protein PMAYCL1PPCAC_18669 [Pristionchus mayeri]